ncbi:MAG: Hsp33 family molecular chaperone HslO [Tissierellia bacterium]|nr:Hsp33 family molecular chaperone HslO [Tissierellia bacterium]
MKDYLIKGMDKESKLRVFFARTTQTVEEARRIHNTSATATAAFGRVLTIGAIMASGFKNDNDLLTLRISGDGPIGNILVVASNNGRVKGMVDNPSADLPSTEDGKLDVGSLVGKNGTLTAIMDLGLKEPYVGQTSLVTGEIGDDIANFYLQSEQVPTAVGLGVLVEKNLSVKAAGGFLIQTLPDILDEEITKIEESLAKAKPLSTFIDQGYTPEEIMKEILSDFEMEITGKLELEYLCDCSRKRVEKVLISLGEKEIEKIIEEDGESEVKCHFCNTNYHFSKEELEKILCQ